MPFIPVWEAGSIAVYWVAKLVEKQSRVVFFVLAEAFLLTASEQMSRAAFKWQVHLVNVTIIHSLLCTLMAIGCQTRLT